MGKLEKLRKRARALPQPFRKRAMGNWLDAEADIGLFPSATREILADCETAIKLHEEDARNGQDGLKG